MAKSTTPSALPGLLLLLRGGAACIALGFRRQRPSPRLGHLVDLSERCLPVPACPTREHRRAHTHAREHHLKLEPPSPWLFRAASSTEAHALVTTHAAATVRQPNAAARRPQSKRTHAHLYTGSWAEQRPERACANSARRYQVLLRSGDKVGDNVYGLLVDKDGKGLELEGEPYISSGNGARRRRAHVDLMPHTRTVFAWGCPVLHRRGCESRRRHGLARPGGSALQTSARSLRTARPLR